MLLFLPIFASFFMIALAGHSNIKRHNALAQRKRTGLSLVPRGGGGPFNGVRATWYQTGLGGCGIWNNPGDYIVALNFPMFGNVYPGPMCFKHITIEYQGKTAQAQITDSCEACPGNGGIDMSEGLFRHFADPAGGVIQVNWRFNEDGPPAPKPKPTTSKWVAPTSKWTPTPQQTTHHTHASPKPTPTSSSTHSTHHSSSSSHHPSSSSSSSSASSSSAAPAVQTPAGPNNIASMYQAFLRLGNVVVAVAAN